MQVQAEPIRETIDHLRDALAWLGEPVVKQKKHNNTLVFKVQPTDAEAGEIHLKVEINCKEHFSVMPMVKVPFKVESSWFTGECEVLTYELAELTGTKPQARSTGCSLANHRLGCHRIPLYFQIIIVHFSGAEKRNQRRLLPPNPYIGALVENRRNRRFSKFWYRSQSLCPKGRAMSF